MISYEYDAIKKEKKKKPIKIELNNDSQFGRLLFEK